MTVNKSSAKGSAAKPVKKKQAHAASRVKSRKATIFTFGAAVALYAVMFPFYRVGDYILGGAVSFLLARLVSALSSGIGHGPNQPQEQAEANDHTVLTGDALADEVIERGRGMIRQVREENQKNPDEELSQKMDELERVSLMILSAIEDNPRKAAQVRRFIDYYLPTTLKMLKNVRVLNEKQVHGQDADQLRAHVSSGVSSVITACQRLLGSLYKDEILDVSTDIDALRQTLKRDGLADGEFVKTEI